MNKKYFLLCLLILVTAAAGYSFAESPVDNTFRTMERWLYPPVQQQPPANTGNTMRPQETPAPPPAQGREYTSKPIGREYTSKPSGREYTSKPTGREYTSAPLYR